MLYNAFQSARHPKVPLPVEASTPLGHTCSLHPPDSASQIVPRSVQPFLHSSRQRIPILYNGPPRPTPLKIAPSYGRSGPHLIRGSLGLPESTTQTASRSVQPFCRAHDCDIPTDRQTCRPTDHATRSVTIGRIYVVLRCGLKRKSACALICHHIGWTT